MTEPLLTELAGATPEAAASNTNPVSTSGITFAAKHAPAAPLKFGLAPLGSGYSLNAKATTSEDRASALALIKEKKLTRLLVPYNGAEKLAEYAAKIEALDTELKAFKTINVPEAKALVQSAIADLSKQMEKASTVATCPHNDHVIDSVVQMKRYADANLPLKVVEEETALIRYALNARLNPRAFLNHDVRSDKPPQSLNTAERDIYRQIQSDIADIAVTVTNLARKNLSLEGAARY